MNEIVDSNNKLILVIIDKYIIISTKTTGNTESVHININIAAKNILNVFEKIFSTCFFPEAY